MIVCYRNSGRLGNRLATTAYYLALVRESGETLVNPSFWRYQRYFAPALSSSIITRAALSIDEAAGKVVASLLEKIMPEAWSEKFRFDGAIVAEPTAIFSRILSTIIDRLLGPSHVNSEDFQITRWFPPQIQRISRHWFETGTSPDKHNSDVDLIWQHREYVKEQFQLHPRLTREIDDWEEMARRSAGKLIGIHVRQGDYANYKGGKWYLPQETYFQQAQAAAKKLEWYNVRYFVASESPLVLPNDGHPWFASLNHAVLDMYALSRCDLIVAVPSTFAGWASFIGAKPMLQLPTLIESQFRISDCEIWRPRLY